MHSIKFVVGFEFNNGGLIDFILLSLAGLLAFGTAAFVFISEFLLAYSSPNSLKNNFYKKRVKLILIPFISMAMFYAIVLNLNEVKVIPVEFFLNLLGNYHGWFIIIIFQFYILHHFMIKYGNRISPKIVLIATFFVNVIYLGVFNFINPPSENSLVVYFWKLGFQRVFLAWVFYFSLAYYIGANYSTIMKILKKYRDWLYLLLAFSTSLVIVNNLLFDFGYFSIIMLFVFSVVASIITIYLLNKFRFGKFAVGRVNRIEASGQRIAKYQEKLTVK